MFEQCYVGLVALDPRHRSHNILGKFLNYLQSGLPVLANVNTGNDLAGPIREHQVGQMSQNNALVLLKRMAERVLKQRNVNTGMAKQCTALFDKHLAVEAKVKQIVAALSA